MTDKEKVLHCDGVGCDATVKAGGRNRFGPFKHGWRVRNGKHICFKCQTKYHKQLGLHPEYIYQGCTS
ncbi:hypothetical protein GR11A_00095 [Vibrio phage vB_VcorM_GR11A]|nr:hypothetical protein GR11A_00095 [Vibrio phage vB_VcorM_GR11A]